MNIINKILYKFKILEFTENKISHWVNAKNYENLVYASEKGNFKIQLKILDEIKGILDLHPIINMVIYLVDDKVQIISENAMKILENQVSDSQIEILKIITDKKNYWKDKKIESLNKKHSTLKYTQTWKENKDSMVRLKQVKKMLKKSMYGERWM